MKRLALSFALSCLLLSFFLLLAPAPVAHAATPIVVNTLSDETTDGDGCSLREAITNANNDAQTYIDCATGSGADTITFSVNGTIGLGSVLPTINDTLTIDGTGQGITINGLGSVQVMLVNSGKTLTLNALTIARGQCSFGCSGGGVVNNGTLNVTNSTFSGNNASGSGGGILNNGTVNLTNSTFSGNGANNGGLNPNGGGGIYNAAGTLNFANTILANFTNNSGDCVMGGGTIGTNQNNSVEDGSCSTNGVNFKTGDPKLGALAWNGGPTNTFALFSASSPAIDAGDDATCAAASVGGKDQRGLTRPQGAHCDIGAYESNSQFGPNFVVNVTEDYHGGSCDPFLAGFTHCSLSEAIDAANLYSGTANIAFSVSGTITLTAWRCLHSH